jgi:hypothetical protein
MNDVINNFFLTLSNGEGAEAFFLSFLALYITACVTILLIDHILE